ASGSRDVKCATNFARPPAKVRSRRTFDVVRPREPRTRSVVMLRIRQIAVSSCSMLLLLTAGCGATRVSTTRAAHAGATLTGTVAAVPRASRHARGPGRARRAVTQRTPTAGGRPRQRRVDGARDRGPATTRVGSPDGDKIYDAY